MRLLFLKNTGSRRIPVILFCILLSLMTAGCTEAAQTQVACVIGVSLSDTRDTWASQVYKDMEAETGDRRDIRLIYLDAEGSAEKQARDLRRFQNFAVDLMIVCPVDHKTLSPELEEIIGTTPVTLLTPREAAADAADPVDSGAREALAEALALKGL